MADIPTCPPPGTLLLYAAPVLAGRDGDKNLTGLLLARDGRIGIFAAGNGLAMELAPDDLVDVGLKLVAIGNALRAEAEVAARDAGAALDRIAAKASHA
jgi:hypothetical protein